MLRVMWCWSRGMFAMILYVLVRRKLTHSCIIIPTCFLSGVAIETRCHDEAKEKTLLPLHAGWMAPGFLSSYDTKTRRIVNTGDRSASHLCGSQSHRGAGACVTTTHTQKSTLLQTWKQDKPAMTAHFWTSKPLVFPQNKKHPTLQCDGLHNKQVKKNRLIFWAGIH